MGIDSPARTPNGNGQTSDVGSYQGDMFASHAHNILRGAAGDNAGMQGGNAAAPLANRYMQTSVAGGSETRPKHVYVNYIIRVK